MLTAKVFLFPSPSALMSSRQRHNLFSCQQQDNFFPSAHYYTSCLAAALNSCDGVVKIMMCQFASFHIDSVSRSLLVDTKLLHVEL